MEGKGRRRQLIEAVAHDIASEVLGHSSKIGSVAVTVKKPHVAVPGQVDYLGAPGTLLTCIAPFSVCIFAFQQPGVDVVPTVASTHVLLQGWRFSVHENAWVDDSWRNALRA